MKETIHLYDSSTIDQLNWPETEEGAFAKKFLRPLMKDGVEHYFDNVKTTVMTLALDDIVLPITINDTEYENSYVCSFYGHYIEYGLSSLHIIKSKFLRKGIEWLLKGSSKLLRMGKINKVVSVNNWLFSTNLYPKLTHEQITRIKEFLAKRFPEHAILFRSVSTYEKKPCFDGLRKNHFDLIASRQVYHTNTQNEEIWSTRIFKSDLKLLRETRYEVIDSDQVPHEEIPKMLSLYNALNVEKYSKMNLQLKPSFLKLALENKLFRFSALKIDGQIEGIVGSYSLWGVMTSPFFGYDIAKPQQNGLYRLLSTLLVLDAKNRGHIFHQSGGASFYKSVRRAEPNMEYFAVYTKHLPFKRRFPWKALKMIINQFGVSFMKKY